MHGRDTILPHSNGNCVHVLELRCMYGWRSITLCNKTKLSTMYTAAHE